MWLKCITTDYISVPQFLALMLWKSANPSDKGGLQQEVAEFSQRMLHGNVLLLDTCFLYPLNVKINPGSLFPPPLFFFFPPKWDSYIYCSQGTSALATARHSAERQHARLCIHLCQDTWILTCNTPCCSKHGFPKPKFLTFAKIHSVFVRQPKVPSD